MQTVKVLCLGEMAGECQKLVSPLAESGTILDLVTEEDKPNPNAIDGYGFDFDIRRTRRIAWMTASKEVDLVVMRDNQTDSLFQVQAIDPKMIPHTIVIYDDVTWIRGKYMKFGITLVGEQEELEALVRRALNGSGLVDPDAAASREALRCMRSTVERVDGWFQSGMPDKARGKVNFQLSVLSHGMRPDQHDLKGVDKAALHYYLNVTFQQAISSISQKEVIAHNWSEFYQIYQRLIS